MGRLLQDMKYETFSAYDPRHTALAESAFLTLWSTLGQWHSELVLVGGLVPKYLCGDLTQNRDLPRPATLDVDLGIALAADSGQYGNLSWELQGQGFKTSPKHPARLEKIVGDFPIYVDFLVEHPPRTSVTAQVEDITASIMPGVDRALGRCGLIERSDPGLNLIVKSAIRQSKSLPDFSGSNAHEVRLKIEGTVSDPKFVQFLERPSEEKLRHFSTYDFLALDAIAKERPLNEATLSRLPGLLEAGAVESQGRARGTRYHLSRNFYATLGRSGAYTRKKGLDHETNKALLEKHLIDSGTRGAPMADLLQVLPALSRAHLTRLLYELRTEGRTHLTGEKRGARWSFPKNRR